MPLRLQPGRGTFFGFIQRTLILPYLVKRSCMRAKIKNILLVCSDARESALLQDFLSNLRAALHITVAATSGELADLLQKNIPDVIIVRVDSEEKDNPRFLDIIRKNKSLDETPVFVYTSSPGKNDLHDLLKKWRKMLSALPL
jgi:CheY-like chemotaxis protein